MCHSTDSHPPAPPDADAEFTGERVVLAAEDGNRFAAYCARAGAKATVGALVLPDVRGLHPYYCRLADVFAQLGMDAVAFDYYGRTAGAAERDDAFEFMPHFERCEHAHVAADATAATRLLDDRALFAVGFCFGGSNAWRMSAELPGLRGAIGFYGHPHRAADVIESMRAPLLVIGAGADKGIPPNDLERFAYDVRRAGVGAELVVYDGMPHSFFDRGFDEHRAACEDAWARMRAFVSANAVAQPV